MGYTLDFLLLLEKLVQISTRFAMEGKGCSEVVVNAHEFRCGFPGIREMTKEIGNKRKEEMMRRASYEPEILIPNIQFGDEMKQKLENYYSGLRFYLYIPYEYHSNCDYVSPIYFGNTPVGGFVLDGTGHDDSYKSKKK
eukprot:TRINITY_DN29_c0_g2_i2.p1 TRINITY_DN29_c0_g2~~TRINITY_DN29_c0_g2_i2.p1  ORF type:complete len:139 (-),score=27.82 TRINITY_DN29_c0_g2_i2:270-686(-)